MVSDMTVCRIFPGWCCLIVAIFLCSTALPGHACVVESAFEGGNARLLSWDAGKNRLVLGSKRKRDDTLAMHLHCIVSQFDSGRELEIALSNLVPPRGLYVKEAGRDWRQIQQISTGKYRSRFPSGRVEIALMPPYSCTRLFHWLEGLRSIQQLTLGTTPDGNRLPGLLLAPPKADTRTPLVMIIGRQHAFEQAASWVIEGMLEFFLSDEPEARRFRSQTVLALVPMANLDGVRAGVSGKQTGSKDWNRTWQLAKPHNPQQNMIRNWLDSLARRYKPLASIDVHAMGYQLASPRFGFFVFDNTRGDPARGSRLQSLRARFLKQTGYPLGLMPLPGWKRLPGMFTTRMQERWQTMIESYTVECTAWRRPDGVEWTAARIKDAGKQFAKAFCGGY